MATIGRFEDFEVWRKARALSKEIYRVSGRGGFYRDFGLKDQIRRTSGSIMDNIAEGAERGGKGEFIRFLGIAKGSAGELQSQLYRAFDQQYINQTEFDSLYTETDKISRMVMALINYLHSTPIRGQRYKNKKPETPAVRPEKKPETQNPGRQAG